jgi:glycosidase
VSRQHPHWRLEFEQTLPDLREADIGGSGFAITGYEVQPDLGDAAALGRLRQRLAQRGQKLMLDYVPNHTGLDHPWVQQHPEYFMAGTAAMLDQKPQNYVRVTSQEGEVVLAHGQDPYFPGWPDTLQLDYSHAATREAMARELQQIACQCDGVRCDMAMLDKRLYDRLRFFHQGQFEGRKRRLARAAGAGGRAGPVDGGVL